MQGVAAEEDVSLLKRVMHLNEDNPTEVIEHYEPDSSHVGNWAMEVVGGHVRFLLNCAQGFRSCFQWLRETSEDGTFLPSRLAYNTHPFSASASIDVVI